MIYKDKDYYNLYFLLFFFLSIISFNTFSYIKNDQDKNNLAQKSSYFIQFADKGEIYFDKKYHAYYLTLRNVNKVIKFNCSSKKDNLDLNSQVQLDNFENAIKYSSFQQAKAVLTYYKKVNLKK